MALPGSTFPTNFAPLVTLLSGSPLLNLCSGATGNLTLGTLRLVNGTTSFSGRVETLRYGVWNPVSLTNSSDGFPVAHVVCKQLGLVGSSNAVAESANTFGFPAANSQWLIARSCNGMEGSLMECQCDMYTMYGYPQTVTCSSAELNSNRTNNAANQLAITCPSGGRPVPWAVTGRC